MSTISLPGQTKISTLQDRFKAEFGLTLRVYDGRSFAEADATIGQVRKKRGATSVDIRRNTKVGNLEVRFIEDFGIKVQIAGSDDSYLCDNALTLAAALEEDRKAMSKKSEKMSEKGPSAAVETKTHGEDEMHTACLTFGSMRLSYIETADGDWIDDPEELEAYRCPGTEDLDSDQLVEWCHQNMTLDFDGDLDDPEVFSTIKAIKLYGPSFAEYGEDGLLLEGTSFYIHVAGPDEITEDNLEDLFHLIVPTLSFAGTKVGFTEFEEYEAFFEDAPEEGKALSVTAP